MYSHVTAAPLSPLRLLVVCAVLLFGTTKVGYSQRVYADAEQHSSPQTVPLVGTVSEVIEPMNALAPDTTVSSSLNVYIGAVGLFSAQQNLQFVNVVKPTASTPVFVKFSTPGSLLDLLGGFSVQRTTNSNNTLVAPSHSGVGLLELLNLFGGGNIATLKIPPTEATFDGVRLTVNTTLGLGRTANYYYAFYITPPQLDNNEVLRCEGEAGTATITNFQTGYTYRLYTAEIDGTEITDAATTTDEMMLPPNLDATPSYWLEARENDTYPSARVRIDITEVPVPGSPHLSISDANN